MKRSMKQTSQTSPSKRYPRTCATCVATRAHRRLLALSSQSEALAAEPSRSEYMRLHLSTPLGSKAALMMLRSMCALSEHLCRSYRKLLNVPAWTGSAERRRTQVPRVGGPSALSRQRVPARLRRNPDSLRLHGCR